MNVIKNEEIIVPNGLRPPKKAAEIPSKPIEGKLAGLYQGIIPVRYSVAPDKPASPPAIAIVKIMFLFSCIPEYFAALRLKPVAFNSYPKVVLFKTI